MKQSARSLIVAGLVGASLAACGSSATTDPAATPAATDPAIATTVDAVAASGPATTVDAVSPPTEAPAVTEAAAPVVTEAAASAAGKVSANDASAEEIAAALEAAGVTNASRWAREIAEYRPYPTDDPTFAKLRDELAKYNPGDGVVDLIVATLVP